jgi:AP-3 complex subunit beta
MKWLLACISKGRNVSDFYPHVVKLVGSPSLEVRKMVYMYLVQYADHDASTRELSLLSINSFQRGLTDNEQLIRALALRVLSSIRVSDVMQIQILAVQKAANDKSPYVRKCAANALAKLSPRCDTDQRTMLLEIMTQLLNHDSSTMVLTSTIVAFTELCPDRLDMLHSSFRKLCHLLTDMDEWGQVMVVDTMARYCRTFFRKPQTIGTAERIDRARRVRRTVTGIAKTQEDVSATMSMVDDSTTDKNKFTLPLIGKRVKRRVVKKGFYSDEEDGSTEEEVFIGLNGTTSSSVVGALRQTGIRDIGSSGLSQLDMDADEDNDLHEDHRLLLRSSLPLLKSRNSGVVLSVCSLQYYCGVSSIKVRSSLGKALVRIHRDRREIQYVVLTSIKTLVTECPSAFAPFLNDFFVKAMDPSFTRMIKLDILTSLALEPASIDAVLKELRNYICHDDKIFVSAAIRAVGKVVELARIVHDRYGEKSGIMATERQAANRTALNSLYGLMTLTMASTDDWIVGECATVMQRIMQQLHADVIFPVDDPNHVQELSMKRLIMLLVKCLSIRTENLENDYDDEEKGNKEHQEVRLPPFGVASAIWITGEWLASASTPSSILSSLNDKTKGKVRVELLRLVAKCFPDMESCEKIQGVHFASKLLVNGVGGTNESALCEHILSMGRADVKTDVRDRSRHESTLLHVAVGLKFDLDSMPELGSVTRNLTLEKAKSILLQNKPPSSALPLDDECNDGKAGGPLRFGTLSSLVGHRTRSAYLPMPHWAEVNSEASLRDPVKQVSDRGDGTVDKVDYGWKVQKNKTTGGFYDSDDDSDSSDDSDDSSSSSEEDSESDDSESDDSSSSDDSEDKSGSLLPPTKPPVPKPLYVMNNGAVPSIPVAAKAMSLVDASSEEEESSDDSSDTSDDSGDSDDDTPQQPTPISSVENLLNIDAPKQPATEKIIELESKGNSYSDGLQGLVMAPVVVDEIMTADPDFERDSCEWISVVRPELGGGLAVMARYLRGPTKAREAKLMGLNLDSPSTVTIQVRFENRRSDFGVLRRIKIIQRSAASGAIAPRRVVFPPEISALEKGKMAMLVLGVEFTASSDKDGSMHGKFEVKSDKGSSPLDVRPPLGELLQPVKMSKNEFEGYIQRLQGFNRVSSSFKLTGGENARIDLPKKLLKKAALTALNKDMKWKDNKFHFSGQLPMSDDKVFVVVTVDDFSRGELLVCCDNAMATNSILDLLKKALV